MGLVNQEKKKYKIAPLPDIFSKSSLLEFLTRIKNGASLIPRKGVTSNIPPSLSMNIRNVPLEPFKKIHCINKKHFQSLIKKLFCKIVHDTFKTLNIFM